MQPYKINVMTLEKIEKLQGKYFDFYTSHDPLLLYDADKLFDFYESATDLWDGYDIKDLEFTVSLTGTVTNDCCDYSPLTTISGSETTAQITMHDFHQSDKNIRSDMCLCFGIFNDQLACTQSFSLTKCEYGYPTVTSLVVVEVGSSSYDFE